MVRKKIDNRIRVMIENGVALGHRTLFVVVGDKARDQVVILHHMLSKASVKARPTVLWCYKKELGFSSHRKKRMKKLEKKIKSGKMNVNEDDPFELFVASTSIRYCYYSETHRILGNTYGMCVLQDFEALTPNLLARSIETVEGGGIVVMLLQSMKSLKQLYTLNMDVHTRYRTEAHTQVVGRFNERFLLSLASCSRCVVLDDSLSVLPLSSHILDVVSSDKQVCTDDAELKELKDNLQDTQPVGVLVNLCKTKDQAKALLKFVEAISEKSLGVTATLTAARGRGKSAALGISIAAAVAFGYSNVFVTSPSPENLKTLFEFIFKGFDALEYQEHIDYELIQSTNPEFNKAVVRVNVFREHRQTIQYIHPGDAMKLSQAELVVIDEAAAIPLPMVKELLGPYLVFMASTVNGYEGTGRSLSLKLIQQLKNQSKPNEKDLSASVTARTLYESTLTESIRYKPGDDVEKWLNQLLCLEADIVPMISSGCPLPQDCDLYYINRDTLFCYHSASENFLQRLMSLYVSSHYKNSPNDLQMMSDAPAHHLFCLLPPVDPQTTKLPEVLCVIQVCLEGEISRGSIEEGLRRGQRAAGDLIPWTVAQQFQDQHFPSLSGARIVRIATHPNYQGMGYGTRALDLLSQYYEGRLPSLAESDNVVSDAAHERQDLGLMEEHIAPRKNLPPLLTMLSERKPEKLQYLGTSFGLTQPLLKFWKKAGYTPVYMRQTPNELTGEHSCVMLRDLEDSSWQEAFWKDFRKRFCSLLGMAFRTFSPTFALAVLTNKTLRIEKTELTKRELDYSLSAYDMKRLELYSKNLADYHLILDLIPSLARLYFLQRCGDLHISPAQAAILVGMGLQQKTADTVAKDLDIETTQLLGLFNRLVRRFVQFLNEVVAKEVEKQIADPVVNLSSLKPLTSTLNEEMVGAEKELAKKQQAELQRLKGVNLDEFAIKGSEDDWKEVLSKGPQGIVSVKSAAKRVFPREEREVSYKRSKKDKKKKRS